MADFDIVSKYLIQHYPDDFARFALGRDDVEGAKVIDPEQLTVEARQTDSLLRVQLDGEEVLVHTEFQTTDSTQPPMARRMVGYIGRTVEEYGLPVVSCVICFNYLTFRRLCPQRPIPVSFPPHANAAHPRRLSEPPPWHNFCNAIRNSQFPSACHGRIRYRHQTTHPHLPG